MPDPADRIPILAALPARERAAVLARARRRTWAPGETLVREGENALNLFLVVSGTARIEQAGSPLARVEAGDFFGELGILEQHARTATVIAETEVTCLLLPAWEFRALLDEHPAMAVPMVHALIARLHRSSPHEHSEAPDATAPAPWARDRRRLSRDATREGRLRIRRGAWP